MILQLFLSLFLLFTSQSSVHPVRKRKSFAFMSSIDEDSGTIGQRNELPRPTLLLAQISAKVARYSQQIVQMILQSMRTPIIQQGQTDKNHLDGLQARKTAPKMSPHRKNKITSALPGSIQRPKMPTSSFLHYYHANKKALAEQWGQKNAAKLTKLASISWRELVPEEKSKYTQLSEQSKQRYQKEMQEFRNLQHAQPSQANQPHQAPKKKIDEPNRIDFTTSLPVLPV